MKSQNKQTAVEWLVEKLMKAEFINDADELIKQAKQMEKEQIIDAVSQGFDNCEDGKVRWLGEQHYNETYEAEKI